MSYSALYPVLAVESPAETSTAFRRLVDIPVVFEADWYVHLKDDSKGMQIGFVRFTHDSVPSGHQAVSRGNFVTLDAEDVREIWEKARNKFKILVPIKDEEWGQRHFICEIPGGVLLDIVQFIDESGN